MCLRQDFKNRLRGYLNTGIKRMINKKYTIEKVNGIWIPSEDEFFKDRLKKDQVFQREHLERALSYMKTDFVFAYDIGAHVGTWSMCMASKFERVISFEPSKLNYECLMKNTSNYNNIYTFNMGVSDRNMHDVVLFKGYRNSGMHYLSRAVNVNEDLELEHISTVRIDDMIRSNSLLEVPNFIKIDVEGHEYQVLCGMDNTLKHFRGVIILEEGPNTHKDRVPSKYLAEKYGFKKVDMVKEDVILVKSRQI